MDRDSGHLSIGGSYSQRRDEAEEVRAMQLQKVFEEELRAKWLREEEEELCAKQRREKRERRKKQQREKKERAERKRREKKELREKEQQLRGLRQSASSCGGIGALVHAGRTGSDVPDSTIIAPLTYEEVPLPRSEEQPELEDELNEPEFDSIEELFEYLARTERLFPEKAQAVSRQHSLDKCESQPVLEQDQTWPLLAPEEARPVAEQEQKSSREEIAQNGKKWMIEEVMLAFQKYCERNFDLKDLRYEFDELHHQCFSIENYHKIFHHFNFTVKMKEPSSNDWTSALYFAEVKEIFSHKIYFCSPLEPYENGHCYVCKNQGMDDLKHPIIGAFERGSLDSISSLIYDSGSDEENYDYI